MIFFACDWMVISDRVSEASRAEKQHFLLLDTGICLQRVRKPCCNYSKSSFNRIPL